MPLDIPGAVEPVPEEYARLLDRLDHLAARLDSQFRIPWTNVRFGWDPIIGLIPVVGDLVMAAISVRLVGLARQLGANRWLTLRMVLNVIIDTLLGAVPIIGPVFDVVFKANLRNLRLLTDEIQRVRRYGPDRAR